MKKCLLLFFILLSFDSFSIEQQEYIYMKLHFPKGDFTVNLAKDLSEIEDLFRDKLTILGFTIINSDEEFILLADSTPTSIYYCDIFCSQEMGSFPIVNFVIRNFNSDILFQDRRQQKLFIKQKSAFLKASEKIASNLNFDLFNNYSDMNHEDSVPFFPFGLEYVNFSFQWLPFKKKIKKAGSLTIEIRIDEYGRASVDEIILPEDFTKDEITVIHTYFDNMPIWRPAYLNNYPIESTIIYELMKK